MALKILQSRLLAIKLKEQKEQSAKLRGEHLSVGWGNQIRSYVLQPYRQVKDHRTEAISTNPDEVLNGNIDLFIDSYLKEMKGQNVRQS
jgi:peptide chain release factor 2